MEGLLYTNHRVQVWEANTGKSRKKRVAVAKAISIVVEDERGNIGRVYILCKDYQSM
jgi:hypothetical protein